MHSKKIISIFSLIVIATVFLLQGDETDIQRNTTITKDELSYHVHYLASEELEGRRAGTPGAYQAAQYIAEEFISYGLYPHPDVSSVGEYEDYLQPFEFSSGIEYGEDNTLIVSINGDEISLTPDQDFKTLPFSSSGSVSGELVFAGFGISASSDEYDDYGDISLDGKIALVFQGSPDINDPHGILNQYATPRNKTFAARESGAEGFIIITQPTDGEESLMRIRDDRNPARSGLPVVNVTPAVANKLLQDTEYTVDDLYNKLLETREPNSFAINGITASIQTDLYTVTSTDQNVMGYLPGNHPEKKQQVIVIGAHYDHLGWGGQGSMAPNEHAIHYGADDNASGTAGMLELAQKFAANRDEIDRSILFMAFGAEELGLIGSRHYVENPYIPNEQTAAMINLDMIGRLQNDELTIFGVGTSPIWDDLIESSAYYDNFSVRTNPDGLGPSDHASFYRNDIPVLFFHTGLHGDYHRPTDTADKINYEGMERIVNYVYDIARTLTTYQEQIAFTRADSPRPQSGMGNISVYVGTMPDLVGESGGMKITEVRSNSPAEKAGLKSGDVIIKFGDKAVENVYDYTYALSDFSPGDVVSVVIERDGEEMTLEVELESRN